MPGRVPRAILLWVPMLAGCSLSTGGLIDDHPADDGAAVDDGAAGDSTVDAGGDDARADPTPDALPPDGPAEDGESFDALDDDRGEDADHDGDEPDVRPDAAPDDAAEAVVDAPIEVELPCGGARIGGHCWYAGGVNEDCNQACLAHGGCDVAGTRDFAGSGGSDANCVAVLAALGYGGFPHQNWSNNELGCHYAWDSWTYWSTALVTACEGSYPGAAARAVRMCACLE